MTGFNFARVTLIGLFFSISAFANTSADECYQHETDPRTGWIYQNRAQWEADRKDLWKVTPRMPSILRLKRGYDVAMVESVKSRGIGSDKRQHCYVGCRIAAEVGADIAEYAAYYKEHKDISDCDPHTHFDLADISATLKGAEAGAMHSVKADAAFCRLECRKIFKK